MPGFRRILSALLVSLCLASPQAARADCVEIGKTCINDNDLKAQVRIGRHTPDLQGLKRFTQLTELTLLADLRFDAPVDLSPLTALPNLERLALVSINAPDIAPLTRLPGLKRLSLDSVRAPDFTPLASMTGLEHLSVWGIEEVTDLSFVRGLTRLQSLNIADSGVTDLSPLEGLEDLEIFLAFNTQVTDLSPLAAANLRVAWISNCPVESVAALAASDRLEMLRADGTRLQNLHGLQNKPALQTLILSDTQVAELAPIADAANLNELALDGTQVSDLSPLAGLNALRKLTLKGTAITSLAPLAGKNLRELSVTDTAVAELDGIEGMDELWELSLSGTGIRDLTPLTGLKKLAILRVIGLPAGALQPLLEIDSLRIVFAGPALKSHKRLLGREKITEYIFSVQ